ncbi:MAG: carboxypeptidase-like regulatory domain-containing protein, partial [Terriglobia bacterium]
LTLTPTSVSWTLDNTRNAVIMFVYAGDLRNPSRMAPGVAQTLRTHGITTQDFPEILKADRFATRSGPLGAFASQGRIFIDSRRFKSLGFTFPYQPPFAPGDKATTLTFKLENSTTESSASSVETAHTVGLTASAEFQFTAFLKTKIKLDNKWTWTNSTTNSTSADAKESASVTIGGPSFGYTGPTNIQVYYDVLYKTFLFVPVGSGLEPSLQGVVARSSKRAVGGTEVVVVANGVKYRTFTNAKGEYRIFDKISGLVQVQVGGVTKKPPLLTPFLRKKVDIVVP